MISLHEIQNFKGPTPKHTLFWISGLAISLFASAILVYSTFKPVSPEFLAIDHRLVMLPLMILGVIGTPVLWIGLILSLGMWFVPFQWASVLVYSVLLIAYREWSRKRESSRWVG